MASFVADRYLVFHFKRRLDGLYEVGSFKLVHMMDCLMTIQPSTCMVVLHSISEIMALLTLAYKRDPNNSDPIRWKFVDHVSFQCLIGCCKPSF